MPCWSVQVSTLEMEVADHDILLDALKDDLGWEVHEARGQVYAVTQQGDEVTIGNGRITATGSAQRAAEYKAQIAQAMGRTTVQQTASRFGWALTQDEKNPNLFKAVRR